MNSGPPMMARSNQGPGDMNRGVGMMPGPQMTSQFQRPMLEQPRMQPMQMQQVPYYMRGPAPQQYYDNMSQNVWLAGGRSTGWQQDEAGNWRGGYSGGGYGQRGRGRGNQGRQYSSNKRY